MAEAMKADAAAAALAAGAEEMATAAALAEAEAALAAAERAARNVAAVPDPGMDRVVDLLGGSAALDVPFSTALEAHEAIQQGFPGRTLMVFVRRFSGTGLDDTIDRVVGVSRRTLQRREKAGGTERLSREQSGRLYKAAEVMAKAADVFGSDAGAQRFLGEPAMALDGMRPIDLLSTPAGVELVERHLGRLDQGVYT